MSVVTGHCPLCTQTRARIRYRLPELEGVRFHCVSCASCGFTYMWPRPDSDFLARYYADSEVYGLASQRAEDYRAIINDKKALLTRLLSAHGVVCGGRAVDFGAGNGTLVKALSELGFDATGIEISQAARETGRRLFGADMRDGTLSQFDTHSLSLVTLFDVLEHMPDPVGTVQEVASRLKPGGIMVAGVPNYNALDRYVSGAGSKALIFPEHVNQFTVASLRQCVSSQMKVLYLGSPPPYGVAITFGLRRSLRRLFGYNLFTQILCNALVALKKYVVYPLPNLFVEKTGLLGQSLLIVARKEA